MKYGTLKDRSLWCLVDIIRIMCGHISYIYRVDMRFMSLISTSDAGAVKCLLMVLMPVNVKKKYAEVLCKLCIDQNTW